ncbi:MAG: hypothetical protein R2788_00460 [Saprospiraceae bacterium]
MSFFDLFKKKESGPVITDMVWINQAAKERGCLQLLRERPDLTLIAWSTVTFDRFQQLLHTDHGFSTGIMTAHSAMPSRMHGKEICFLEHHLFHSKEIALLQSWKCEKALFLNSLEDPVFHLSNAERIVAMMERMGHQEDEVIEHAMVTKSIKRAQEKMEKEGGVKDMSEEMKAWWHGVR